MLFSFPKFYTVPSVYVKKTPIIFHVCSTMFFLSSSLSSESSVSRIRNWWVSARSNHLIFHLLYVHPSYCFLFLKQKEEETTEEVKNKSRESLVTDMPKIVLAAWNRQHIQFSFHFFLKFEKTNVVSSRVFKCEYYFILTKKELDIRKPFVFPDFRTFRMNGNSRNYLLNSDHNIWLPNY